MKSRMIAGRGPGRLLASLSLIALSLAACNKRADQVTATPAEGTQPAMAPPLAALPLATAQAPDLAVAPEASQLPWPKQKIRTAQRTRYDRYGYIDSAYDMGYAFADINPEFRRDPETRTMAITFNVGESPRTYVERIDVNGNTLTHDKVVRREFRLNEGDAFNAFKVKRSQDRIQSLGFFQENLEIKQEQGS